MSSSTGSPLLGDCSESSIHNPYQSLDGDIPQSVQQKQQQNNNSHANNTNNNLWSQYPGTEGSIKQTAAETLSNTIWGPAKQQETGHIGLLRLYRLFEIILKMFELLIIIPILITTQDDDDCQGIQRFYLITRIFLNIIIILTKISHFSVRAIGNFSIFHIALRIAEVGIILSIPLIWFEDMMDLHSGHNAWYDFCHCRHTSPSLYWITIFLCLGTFIRLIMLYIISTMKPGTKDEDVLKFLNDMSRLADSVDYNAPWLSPPNCGSKFESYLKNSFPVTKWDLGVAKHQFPYLFSTSSLSSTTTTTTNNNNTNNDKNTSTSIIITCGICNKDIENRQDVFVTKCKHVYHTECALKWSKLCPCCPICTTYPVLPAEEVTNQV